MQMKPGVSAAITLTAKVKGGVALGTNISNSVLIGPPNISPFNTRDPNTVNDSVSTTVVVGVGMNQAASVTAVTSGTPTTNKLSLVDEDDTAVLFNPDPWADKILHNDDDLGDTYNNYRSQKKETTRGTTVQKLTRTLALGEKSDDVRLLQTILSFNRTIYPEGLVTGYFGPITEAAVKRFQARYGIEQIGYVGPLTRAKLNEIFGKQTRDFIIPTD
jgi:hypothetical protein